MVDPYRWYDIWAPSETEIQAEFERRLERAKSAKKRREEDRERREKVAQEEREKPGSLMLRYQKGLDRGQKKDAESGKEWTPRVAGSTLGRKNDNNQTLLDVLEEIEDLYEDLNLVENGTEREEAVANLIEAIEEDLEHASSDQHRWFQDQPYRWEYLSDGRLGVFYLGGRGDDLAYVSPEPVRPQ